MKIPNWKVCISCKENKPLEEYHRHKNNKDGRAYACKVCRCKQTRKWVKDNPKKYKRYRQSPHGQYIEYKHRELNRRAGQQKAFELTEKEFISFVGESCHYCGETLDKIRIDRVDSNDSYNIWNVVPCCKPCNVAKNDRSAKDYINRCKKVVLGHA